MQRRKADAAGDEQKVLSLERGVHRETVAVGAADQNFLPHVHLMQPRGQAAALFDGEFHEILLGGGGGDGEHRFTHAGDGEHGALAGLVLKHLAAAERVHAEGFDVGRVGADGRDHAELGNQILNRHVSFLPAP